MVRSEVDSNSREPTNLTTKWGYCPEHLVLRPEDCAENYDKVEDNCVRVSPYPLTWSQAEEKCADEGGHLLHILSQEVQDGVEALIKAKLRLKDFFTTDKWSTGLSSDHEQYWIGGKVFRQSEWKWIGNQHNMSAFSKWEKGKEGEPCGKNCFDFSHRLLINKRAGYSWRAEDQGKALPYICISNCIAGYSWRANARRCVRMVEKTQGLEKQAAASVKCADDGGRLLSINSCQEMEGLQQDLWRRSLDDSYWVGSFSGGFQNYEGQTRTSEKKQGFINSRGELGVKDGGSPGCADASKIVASGLGSANDGYFASFEFTASKVAQLEFSTFQKGDSATDKGYLCEKETEWSCPDPDWVLFQELCYKFNPENVTLGSADHECKKEGGVVAQVDTRLHATFLNAWLQQYNFTKIWLGHRRHTTTTGSGEDTVYTSVTGGELTAGGLMVGDFQAAGGTADVASHDCLLMDSSEGDHNGWRTASCSEFASYVCQVEQQLSEEKLLGLPPLPELLMPLDLISGFGDYHVNKRRANVSNVAITYSDSPENNLRGAAQFTGRPDSYIQLIPPTKDDEKVVTKFGITISAWVFLDKLDLEDRAVILDASGPCTAGSEQYNSFQLWIEKSRPVASGTGIDPPEACASITTIGPDSGGGADEYIKVKVILCDGPVVGVSPIQAGNCATYESASSMPLTERKWEYVGFSFDTFTRKGTFVINKMYGYQGTGPMESQHFTYSSSLITADSWFGEGSLSGFEGPLRVGSKKYQKPGSWSGLVGKLSCLQIHSGGLSPAQVFSLY